MNIQDYKSLFEQSSSITLVIDRDYTIVDASNQYLKITKTVRKNIVGKNIFDVFPDHPSGIDAQGQSKMLASFNRVLKSKQSDVLPVVKKDISKQKSKTGELGVQYWKLCHSAVLDEFKKVKYIIQRVEDATETSVLATQLEAEQITIKKYRIAKSVTT